MATIAAARRPPNILSTFGAPRVGNNFFNQTVDREKWFRVVYSRDPVPWIPPKNFFWLGYEQGGRLIFIDEDGLFHEINEEESTTPEFRFKHTFRPFRGKRNPWEWIDKTIQTGPVIVETGGPELEIPRSAGFSVHFEHLHKRPISDNDFIIPWLKKHVRELPPPYLFELARRILFINPRNAVEYFFLGFIRIQYDALRCKDKSLHHAVLLWLPIAKNVVEFIQQNPNIAGAAGLTALEKEKTFPGDNSPEWVCHHGMNAFVAGMEGKELKDWHISKSEWPKVREECRSQVVGFSEELQDSET